MVAESHRARVEHLDLADDELRQGALERLPVDVGSPGGGEQGHVGPQLPQDRRPATRAGAPQDRPVGRRDQIDQLAAVVIRAGADRVRHVLVEVGGHGRLVTQEPKDRVHPGPPLL